MNSRAQSIHEAAASGYAQAADSYVKGRPGYPVEIQGWLRDLGLALGFRIWVASNDRGRPYANGRLGDGCLDVLPASIVNCGAEETIRLIDVLWLENSGDRVAAAFEVEHSTSIYSGIVRMLDLALGLPDHLAGAYFLVAPDDRENAVKAQFARPAISRVSELDLRYLPYSELRRNREHMAAIGRRGGEARGHSRTRASVHANTGANDAINGSYQNTRAGASSSDRQVSLDNQNEGVNANPQGSRGGNASLGGERRNAVDTNANGSTQRPENYGNH